jgi:hypothetical protein
MSDPIRPVPGPEVIRDPSLAESVAYVENAYRELGAHLIELGLPGLANKIEQGIPRIVMIAQSELEKSSAIQDTDDSIIHPYPSVGLGNSRSLAPRFATRLPQVSSDTRRSVPKRLPQPRPVDEQVDVPTPPRPMPKKLPVPPRPLPPTSPKKLPVPPMPPKPPLVAPPPRPPSPGRGTPRSPR